MSLHLSRRDFLGLASMATIAGGISCTGGVIGYLVIRAIDHQPTTEAIAQAVPSPTAGPRPDRLKQIDRPPITLRADWNARQPNHQAINEPGFYSLTNVEGWREYEGDLRAIYRTVVVHHAALYKTDDPTTMRHIQDTHMDKRDWADIGYHFGVGKTGQVFEGRDLMARGTHTEGYNTGSVGVVFFGHLEITSPTPEQMEAGRQLIDWLALRLELTHLAGHHDFNDFTECPGRNMIPYLPMLADSAGLLFGTDGYQPPPEQLVTPTPTPP